MLDSSYPGYFICIEGIDGTGKTTHARLLVSNLRSLGYDAVYTTEPTRWSIPGRKLRESFFASERLSAKEEFLLFLQDRILHIRDEIKPQLEEGKIVITDRYYFSSVAYQGSRGLDWKYILEENLKVAIIPDIVVLIDLTVEEALNRISSERKEGVNIFEKKESLSKVKEIYQKLEVLYPKLIKKFESSLSKEETQKAIFSFVKQCLEEKNSLPTQK